MRKAIKLGQTVFEGKIDNTFLWWLTSSILTAFLKCSPGLPIISGWYTLSCWCQVIVKLYREKKNQVRVNYILMPLTIANSYLLQEWFHLTQQTSYQKYMPIFCWRVSCAKCFLGKVTADGTCFAEVKTTARENQVLKRHVQIKMSKAVSCNMF